jgi:hypothetical protein
LLTIAFPDKLVGAVARYQYSMKRFIAIVGLAFILVLCPQTGQAQQSNSALTAKSVGALHRSHFTFGKLSTREKGRRIYVDGEITSNAKKEADTVYILVRWFDKSDKVIAHDTARVNNLAPGETLPFHASTDSSPEIARYDVTIKASAKA